MAVKATVFEYRDACASYAQELLCECGCVFWYYITDPENTKEREAICPDCGEKGEYKTPCDWAEPYYGKDSRDTHTRRES
jgi:hypothetical protein